MVSDPVFRSEERFTQAEFFGWVQDRPASDIHHYELLGGRIVMTPLAGFPNAAIEVRISSSVLQHASPAKLGMVFGASAGIELPSGDTVQPDVTFVSTAAMAAGPKPVFGEFVRVVPTLVVEVVSPVSAKLDRIEKKKIYERNGVGEYWIVDSRSRQVIVYRRTDNGYSKPLHVVKGAVESAVLPGLRIALSEIFADCD